MVLKSLLSKAIVRLRERVMAFEMPFSREAIKAKVQQFKKCHLKQRTGLKLINMY